MIAVPSARNGVSMARNRKEGPIAPIMRRRSHTSVMRIKACIRSVSSMFFLRETRNALMLIAVRDRNSHELKCIMFGKNILARLMSVGNSSLPGCTLHTSGFCPTM